MEIEIAGNLYRFRWNYFLKVAATFFNLKSVRFSFGTFKFGFTFLFAILI